MASDNSGGKGCAIAILALLAITFVSRYWIQILTVLVVAGVLVAAYHIIKYVMKKRKREQQEAERQRRLAEEEKSRQAMEEFESEVLSEL